MQDISSVGTVVVINASTTFPNGLTITQFADDADPLDFAALQIADTAMGSNGDLLTWGKANPTAMTLNVVPAGPDDTNLQILGNANRVAQGKVSAKDVITATVVYPDGRVVIKKNGKLTQFSPGLSISSAQRLKTQSYVFSFES